MGGLTKSWENMISMLCGSRRDLLQTYVETAMTDTEHTKRDKSRPPSTSIAICTSRCVLGCIPISVVKKNSGVYALHSICWLCRMTGQALSTLPLATLHLTWSHRFSNCFSTRGWHVEHLRDLRSVTVYVFIPALRSVKYQTIAGHAIRETLHPP